MTQPLRPEQPPRRRPARGFTLIELMVAVAVVAILAKVALPAFTAYLQRAKVPPALDGLSAHAVRMEQRFQDTGNYGTAGCAVAVPTANHFTFSCTLTGGGQGFTTTATGSGTMAGYSYTINQLGTRVTTGHPLGLPSTNCWSTRGGSCDT